MAQTIESVALDIRRCDEFDTLFDVFLSFFRDEGVTKLSYHHKPPLGASDYSPVVAVLSVEFAEDGSVKSYQLRDDFHDPLTKWVLSSVHAIRLSELRSFVSLSADERAYLDAMEKTGLADGVAIPLFGPNGRDGYGVAGRGSGNGEWRDEEIARLHIVGQLCHQRYCEILFAQAPRNIQLSDREREILTWISQGKSNSVVADILNISPNTVDTHLRRIFNKLDVGDRVTAALRGLAIGVIG